MDNTSLTDPAGATVPALVTLQLDVRSAEDADLVIQESREALWRDGEIRRTRRAIEEGREEFTDPEGLVD